MREKKWQYSWNSLHVFAIGALCYALHWSSSCSDSEITLRSIIISETPRNCHSLASPQLDQQPFPVASCSTQPDHDGTTKRLQRYIARHHQPLLDRDCATICRSHPRSWLLPDRSSLTASRVASTPPAWSFSYLDAADYEGRTRTGCCWRRWSKSWWRRSR